MIPKKMVLHILLKIVEEFKFLAEENPKVYGKMAKDAENVLEFFIKKI